MRLATLLFILRLPTKCFKTIIKNFDRTLESDRVLSLFRILIVLHSITIIIIIFNISVTKLILLQQKKLKIINKKIKNYSISRN